MKPKSVAILALSILAYALLVALRNVGYPISQLLDRQPQATSPAAREAHAEPMPEQAAEAEPPPLQQYAADCFRTLRARNSRGRILRLNANRLGDRCSMVIETDIGSGRWLFDWRNHSAGHVHEGELRWPESWPSEIPQIGIEDAEFAAERLQSLTDEARALWPDQPHVDWLYEIVWLPAPFARPLAYITLADRSEGADSFAAFTVIFDGSARLPDADYEQAFALYPMTRFELREDHNFKGPLYESTALAESAVSLEGDPDAGDPHPLAASIENCMYWLHAVNTGNRVLRVGIDATRCFLVLENAGVRDDYYLLEASGPETYTEHASLIVEPLPTPNLLLDRSRISAARVRERLQQAIELAGSKARIERLAIAWIDGAMFWQFDGSRDGARALVYLDESGAPIEPAGGFPVTVHEREAGFANTRPAMPFIVEAASP
jgi:hypothetical protein